MMSSKCKYVTVSVNGYMPSVLPWLNIYYEIDGVQYMKSTMDDASGIQSPVHSSTSAAGAVFGLDGRRLPGVPTQKGIYISQGRKFVVR